MDDKELDDKIEQLKNASDVYRHIIEDAIKNRGKLDMSEKQAKEAALKWIEAINKGKKTFVELDNKIKTLNKSYKENILTAEDLEEELESLRRQINRTTDQDKKSALIKAKSELEEASARAKAAQIFGNSLGNVAGSLAKGVATTFSNVAKTALSTGDGFQAAGTMLTGQIETMNAGVQAGANAFMDFGKATAGAGGKLGGLGVAAAGLGAVVSAVSSQMSELAKAGIGFMIAQTQKTITSFQSMSNAGALFAGGMQDMRKSALESGLTLEQYSKVVTQNAARMADGGMSVTAATREIAKTGKIMKDSGIQQSLLNLGYSFEEQAALSAKVMSDMNRGLRPGQRATAQEIAEQTAKYAENLKLISDLTGEDAKAKAEKVRDENAELAFEAQKAKMSKDQRAQLDVAMAGMTELERKNLRERMVFGTVINRAGAIQESIVEGQREKGLRYAELLKQNNLTTQTVTNVNSQYAKQIKDSTLANADTIGKAGMALGGDLASLAKNQADSLRQSNQYNAENVAETKKNLEKTKQGVGSEGIVNAQQAAQDFANKLEALATDNLDSFGTALTTTIKDITKAVEYLKDESILGRLSKIDWTLVAMSALPAMLATAVPAIIAMVGKSGIGAAAGGAGGAVKSALGGMAKGGIAAIGGVGLSMAGNAVGGKTGAGMDVAGQALSYGGTGAMLGTAFGPLGTLIGAGVGATIGAGMGLYQNYGTLTGTTDDYSGLSIKGAESTAGGRASSALVEKARRLQEMFPGGYFSAFNDAYHNRYKPNSEHASGKAFDFVLPFSVKGDEKKAQEVLAQIKSLGFSQVLDEYNHPSAGATGQHIHAQLDSGGYVPTGSTALVGERGPEVIQGPATVTSRVQTDNMASKISELAELFKQIVGQNTEMLNILKDHKDISRKLLSATA